MVGIAEQYVLLLNGLTGLAVLGFVGVFIYLFYDVFRGKWPSHDDNIESQHRID